jgi:hypothetical protein
VVVIAICVVFISVRVKRVIAFFVVLAFVVFVLLTAAATSADDTCYSQHTDQCCACE